MMEATDNVATTTETTATEKTATNASNASDHHHEEEEEAKPSWLERLSTIYWENEFLILVVTVILLARAYPKLGAEYFYPEITATWIAVLIIFVMAGLGLKTEEFKNALQQFKFNLFVQAFNFLVVSSIAFGISRLLDLANIISQDLADGMVIAASLPMTINMVLVLTKASGGEEAAAIFNAAAGNLVGVFFSPLLILGYLGVSGDVDLFEVFYKLALRVVLPVLVGQLLRTYVPPVVNFYKKHKKRFKKVQEYSLVFIVYTVFCRTFQDENDSSIADIFVMILFQFILLTGLMCLAWVVLRQLFPNEPKLRVMGLFGCTHKTVAMGVPLINAIYEDNEAVGLYTLPLLIWHPSQLVIGSFLAPRLARFVKSENQRLGLATDDEDDDDEENGDGKQKGGNEQVKKDEVEVDAEQGVKEDTPAEKQATS